MTRHSISYRRTLLVGMVVLALTLVSSAILGASAAEASSEGITKCAVVLGKVKQGERESAVLSTSCTVGSAPEVAASSVPILTIWQNLNYTGRSKTFYGGDGPCDAAGYIIKDVGREQLGNFDWRKNVSSMQWGNNCSYINAYQAGLNTGFCFQYHGNVGYVGAVMNDKIWSLHVQSAPRVC
jgi:hypothetical protein